MVTGRCFHFYIVDLRTDAKGSVGRQGPWGSGPSDDISRPLYGGNRYVISSKGVTRTYSYYTLRRVRNYDDNDLKNRYRAMPENLADAGRIVDAVVSKNPS